MRLALAAERCDGCRLCEEACALERFGIRDPDSALLRVSSPAPSAGFTVVFCDQCGVCAEVCPTDAVKLNAQGVWTIEPEDCITCNICVDECVPDVMQRSYEHPFVPFKCNACGQCVATCPTGALYDADRLAVS